MTTISKKIVLYTIVSITAICFLCSSITLLVPSAISISSWRAIDFLIWSLPLYFLLGIVALGPWTLKQIRLSIGFLTIGVIVIAAISSSDISSLALLNIVVRSIALGYYTSRKYTQLHTRTNRTSRAYITSFIGVFINCLTVVVSIGMMARITDTGFSCEQIESSLRLSGLAKKLESTQLSDLLGITADQVPALSSSESGPSQATESGILGMLFIWKERLVDLAVEQQAFLNHSICTLISDQIEKIHNRPWRQVAGVLLTYLLFRPLVGALVRVLAPLGTGLRHILLRCKIVHKKQIQLPATVVRLWHT